MKKTIQVDVYAYTKTDKTDFYGELANERFLGSFNFDFELKKDKVSSKVFDKATKGFYDKAKELFGSELKENEKIKASLGTRWTEFVNW